MKHPKLASNTASFSCVVNVDGINSLEEEETLPFTLVVLADLVGEEAQEYLPPAQDEVLQAALDRTICPSAKGRPHLPRERCQARLRTIQC